MCIEFFSCSDYIDQFRLLQIRTVGDLARSTIAQIETYPIPSPKLSNIDKALSAYRMQLDSSSLPSMIRRHGDSSLSKDSLVNDMSRMYNFI
jgi:hypothetical protein